MITIHRDIHQGHEKWDAWRSTRATCSELDKIYTGSGKVSAQREAYMRKCAVSRKYKLPSFNGNQYTDRGHELEPEARDLFVSLSGVEVEQVACMEAENELWGGSPDGIIVSTDTGVLISGLEIKCYLYDKHMTICQKRELPTPNKPQVHGFLALTKAPCWQFMAYNPDAMPFDHTVIEVTQDNYTDNLYNEVMKFCEELNQKADEFIHDFEKSMQGVTMKAAMPVLFNQLN